MVKINDNYYSSAEIPKLQYFIFHSIEAMNVFRYFEAERKKAFHVISFKAVVIYMTSSNFLCNI